MIKKAIFDIDGTLYNYEKGHKEGMRQLCSYVQDNFQMAPEKFEEEYQRIYQEIIERLGKDNAAIHSRSIRIQNLLEKWGKPLFPHIKAMYHAYWDTLLKETGPEPGIFACLQELKDRGIGIGIGTDMTAGIQYEKLEAFGFASFISYIVTSQEAGVEKPHPDFMALCIRKAGVLPEECVFVGDHFWKDACGAAASGMHGIWYNPSGKELPEEIEAFGDKFKEIHHFDELIPYICTLNREK